ncbi:MAG: hypothetical protein L3K04_00060 [Thermoplasmata archaeon]|nr:hypothetical protein [Thermoplasmata archaeon]MCI4342383.1 hypothetical protein [Thermoplasmata archaeon]
MRLRRLAWIGPASLLLLALLPVAGATAPVQGTVTKCTNTYTCSFVFNTSAGTGWAKTTLSPLSFQQPGEAKASYNLTYATYIEKLTGTYTHWTVGNFHGTDVNIGKVVVGATNTNFTITVSCSRGCHDSYTTDNGTIVFHFTKAELTSTSVTCSPSSLSHSNKTTCTAAVTNLWNSTNVPKRTVYFSSGGLGPFANHAKCNLTAGSCSVTRHPNDDTVGTVTTSGIYGGTAAFYKGSSYTHVTVSGGE